MQAAVRCLLPILRLNFRDCMCPVVLTRGSDQMAVSTKFDMRNDDNVIRNYGRMLIELSSAIPDGVVCFFVSYSYMDQIVSKWNEMGILQVGLTLFGKWSQTSRLMQSIPCHLPLRHRAPNLVHSQASQNANVWPLLVNSSTTCALVCLVKAESLHLLCRIWWLKSLFS